MPFFIGAVFDTGETWGALFRFIRVLKIIGVARNNSWAQALRVLVHAVMKRRRELILSFSVAGFVLLISATLLYVVEGNHQPEAFGSIPRALWWAMATLTTVGYGDVYPVTVLGKICAGISAITAIAIVAMPTGIMAAAFSDAFHTIRDSEPPE